MPETSESKREKYERFATECREMAAAFSDPKRRAAFTAMAETWSKLADEIPQGNQ